MLKIQLKQAMLDVNINKVTLYFTSESGYNLAWLSLKKMDICKYVLFGGSDVNVETPYITIVFWDKEGAEAFFRNHVKQECDEQPTLYADDGLVCRFKPQVYLYLPEASAPLELDDSEGIRGGKIPVRTLKLDDLEKKRKEYKTMLNSLYGITSMSITGPRRNGKSIFFPGYHYEPIKDISGVAIATVNTEVKEDYEMLSCNIPNFWGKFEMKPINQAPLYIRSVQINEKKGVVTIVWRNGEVTMAKCGPNDEFDVEKGIAIAFMKHWFASTTQMNKWMREQTKDYYERTFENGFEEDRFSLKDLVENFIKEAK